MKKLTRFIFTVTALLSVQAIVNHLIFNETRRRNAVKISHDYFKWSFGKIRYVTAGEGEPLLLIHGIDAGGSLHEWERSIDTLSKHYKVYALDLLGFGYSDKPALSYSAYLYIRLICDFMKKVIKKPAYVAASSNSAAYAVAAANFSPELFKKLLLISPTGAGTSNVYVSREHSLLKKVLELPIIGTTFFNVVTSRTFCKWFLKEYVYSDYAYVTDELVNKYYYPAHFGGADNRYALAAFVSNYLNVDIERLIGKIDVPVHVVWGEDNILNPVGNFHALRLSNPEITLSLFEDTKLLPHVEKPKAFYKVCRKFFKENSDY